MRFFLQKKKYIEVCSFSKDKTYISYINKYKINYFKTDLELFSTPISFRMLRFISKRAKEFDYIHIHTPNPWSTICLIFSNPKKIIVSWGSDIINQKLLKFFFLYFQNKLLNKAKKIICLSKEYLNYSKDLSKFKRKTLIIPPIINTKKNLIRKKILNKVQVVSIGRLVDYKSFETAINAFQYLPINFRLKIIGSGKLRNKLNLLIKNLKLQKRVKILSNINDDKKFSILKNSDIFILCSNSRAESFGISILEAISFSLPLVISNVKGSGMRDMIKNNINGLSFKVNSSKDCAKKILAIGSNRKNIIKFSNNSSRIFKRKFGRKFLEKKLLKIYD